MTDYQGDRRTTFTRMADNAALIWLAATGRLPRWARPDRAARIQPRAEQAVRDVNALRP